MDEADCDLSISKCMLQSNLEDEECFRPNVAEFGQHFTMFRVRVSLLVPSTTRTFGAAHIGHRNFSRPSSEQYPAWNMHNLSISKLQ